MTTPARSPLRGYQLLPGDPLSRHPSPQPLPLAELGRGECKGLLRDFVTADLSAGTPLRAVASESSWHYMLGVAAMLIPVAGQFQLKTGSPDDFSAE
jgi:hypothetical protein